jgi:hypothetical protein
MLSKKVFAGINSAMAGKFYTCDLILCTVQDRVNNSRESTFTRPNKILLVKASRDTNLFILSYQYL